MLLHVPCAACSSTKRGSQRVRAGRSGARQGTQCRSNTHKLSLKQDQKDSCLCYLQQLQRLAPQTGMKVPSCARAVRQHTARGNGTSTSSMQGMLEAMGQHCSGNTRPGKTVLHLVAQALWRGALLSLCSAGLRCGEAGQSELFSALLSIA